MEKLIEALKKLDESFSEVNGRWEDLIGDDTEGKLPQLGVEYYPFDDSFEAIAWNVRDWVQAFTKQLESLKKA